MKVSYTRYCPSCNNVVTYSSISTLNRAIRKSSKCKECLIDKNNSRNCPCCKKEIIYKLSKYKRRAEKKNQVCLYCSNEGIKNPRYGKTLNNDIKEKIRSSNILTLKKLEKTTLKCNYNPKACLFINELNKSLGWNLIHAENGGEVKILNYYVDGYDKKLNIVFEYDEPIHFRKNSLKEKDVKRMNEIKSHLNCKFFRYNEKTKELKEY